LRRISVASCGYRMPEFAARAISWAMNRGTTLIEMLVGLVIIGLISSAALPAVRQFRDRYTVQSAASEIAGAHNRARIRAVLEGQVADLEIRADSLLLRVAASAVWSAPGPLAAGVTLTSPPRTLSFAPSGVTMGFANATFVLTKGSVRRQVVVSRLGRVRIIP
jgi:prepilin-type N-terminal cleavage/methylation domain-containing protein